MARSTPDYNSRQAKIDAAAPKKSKATPIVAAVIVLLVVAGVVWAVVSGLGSQSGDDGGNMAVPAAAEAQDGGLVMNQGEVAAGAPRVDIYMDPQCPACAVVDNMLKPAFDQLAADNTATVSYHLKTFMDDNLRNDSSMRAANGMVCASDVGAFPQYRDQIYAQENRGEEGAGWTDVQLEQFAGNAGITGANLEDWKSCVSADTYQPYLEGVEDKSARDGVTATPTIRINGEDFQVQQNTTPQDFLAAVEAAK